MLRSHFWLDSKGVLRSKKDDRIVGTLEKKSGYYRLDFTHPATKERYRVVRHVVVYCLHHGVEMPEPYFEEVHHKHGLTGEHQDHPSNLELLSRIEHRARGW